VYFDISKDTLYTAAPNWKSRRSVQTALYRLNYALVRLLAPIMAFTTDEVWGYMKRPAGAPESVHLSELPAPEELTVGITVEQRARVENWNKLIPVRDYVLKSLETARQEKLIGAPLEARVRLQADNELYPLLEQYARELPSLFIVSQVDVKNGAGELAITVERAAGEKCERCWKYRELGSDARFPTICTPCAEAVRDFTKGAA
jgi:isoleucyl-tRNA synthetase